MSHLYFLCTFREFHDGVWVERVASPSSQTEQGKFSYDVVKEL
jgi:hypothetical protein